MIERVAIDESHPARWRSTSSPWSFLIRRHLKATFWLDLRRRVRFKVVVHRVSLNGLAPCVGDETSSFDRSWSSGAVELAVHDGFFLYGPIDVIGSVLQGQFRKMVTDVHSIGFDVRVLLSISLETATVRRTSVPLASESEGGWSQEGTDTGQSTESRGFVH